MPHPLDPPTHARLLVRFAIAGCCCCDPSGIEKRYLALVSRRCRWRSTAGSSLISLQALRGDAAGLHAGSQAPLSAPLNSPSPVHPPAETGKGCRTPSTRKPCPGCPTGRHIHQAASKKKELKVLKHAGLRNTFANYFVGNDAEVAAPGKRECCSASI